MADTSYLCRVIYKEHTGDLSGAVDFAGSYKLMLAAKSIPAPAQAPDGVESTTFEDDTQTYEMGIKKASTKEITGNLAKSDLQSLNKLAGKKLDIMQLYGTDGIGGTAKYAYVGTAVATPNDVSGVDSILEMTATVVPSTASIECTDDYTIVDNSDGTFTVSKAEM